MKIEKLPDFRQNLISKLLRHWHDSRLDRQKRRLSSANRRQGVLLALDVILNPIAHFFVFCAFRSSLVSTSMQIINKYGDEGSPWRISLEGEKNHVTS